MVVAIIGKLLKMCNIKLIIYKATVCSLYNVQVMNDRWIEAADEKVLSFKTQYRLYCRLELVSVQIVCTVWINVAVRLHIEDMIIRGVLVLLL